MTRKELTAELALALGAELLRARPPQVSWKMLSERYGLCKARLVQLRHQALRQLGAT